MRRQRFAPRLRAPPVVLAQNAGPRLDLLPRLGLLALLLAFSIRQAQAANDQRQAHPLYDEGDKDEAEGKKENLVAASY